MLNTFKQLHISIRYFQDILKSKHDVYINVYNLFTASHEVSDSYFTYLYSYMYLLTKVTLLLLLLLVRLFI